MVAASALEETARGAFGREVRRIAIYEFEGRVPQIGEGTYISPQASVIGEVTIGKECFIAPGARIKGDYGTIIIGSRTSIQENCVLHAAPGERLEIGSEVTVGHGAILHHCKICDQAVIGMGAIITYFAEVGEGAIIGEGSVVGKDKRIPPKKIAVGVPARTIRDVSEEEMRMYKAGVQIYVEMAKRYAGGLKEVRKV